MYYDVHMLMNTVVLLDVCTRVCEAIVVPALC